MKLTTLFRLRKPDGTDPVNIEDFNENFDVIDEELGKRLESTGNASDMTTAFTQASTRTNLKTGEKISASFGKIMKWFADLKAVAFSGSYNDLSNKPSIPSGAAASQAVANNCTTTATGSVLDARQGKVLMDKTNQLSIDLGGLSFGQDAEGNWGYKPEGADAVVPFRMHPIHCGAYAATMNYSGYNLNIDIKPYFSNYKKLTEDNFFIIVNTINFSSTTAANVGGTVTYSYDADTGTFTVYGKVPNNFWSAAINFDLYIINI